MSAAALAPACEATRLEKPVRVLTVTPFFPARGDETQGCFVAEPLSRMEGLAVANSTIAVRPFYRGRAVVAEGPAPAQWVHFFAVPTGIGLSSAGAFLHARLLGEVSRSHRRRPFDLIHAHSALPCGHAAALLSRELNIPFVVTVHGLDAFFTQQVGGYAGSLCARVAGFVYRSARKVICVSEQIRDRVKNQPENGVDTAVVYNGVDSEMFFPAISEPSIDRILSVGNLIAVKGHELLIRAFAALRGRYSYAQLDIIGDGPERGRVQNIARNLQVDGRVRFLGRQSRGQVAEAMRCCTIFALPSRYEGLGCVYLEAMSSGKAVIACRGQGIGEVIQHGVNGWLVEPDNLDELTESLATLLQESGLRRRLGETARHTILRSYTLQHQAARLAALYRDCLS